MEVLQRSGRAGRTLAGLGPLSGGGAGSRAAPGAGALGGSVVVPGGASVPGEREESRGRGRWGSVTPKLYRGRKFYRLRNPNLPGNGRSRRTMT